VEFVSFFEQPLTLELERSASALPRSSTRTLPESNSTLSLEGWPEVQLVLPCPPPLLDVANIRSHMGVTRYEAQVTWYSSEIFHSRFQSKSALTGLCLSPVWSKLSHGADFKPVIMPPTRLKGVGRDLWSHASTARGRQHENSNRTGPRSSRPSRDDGVDGRLVNPLRRRDPQEVTPGVARFSPRSRQLT